MEEITKIIYDEERLVLEVEIEQKTLYLFTKIGEEIFEKLSGSKSKYTYFQNQIMKNFNGVQIR